MKWSPRIASVYFLRRVNLSALSFDDRALYICANVFCGFMLANDSFSELFGRIFDSEAKQSLQNRKRKRRNKKKLKKKILGKKLIYFQKKSKKITTSIK